MKSHFFAELIIDYAVSFAPQRILCVREVQKTLKESSKKLIEDKIQALDVGSQFRVMEDRIETPGDGAIMFQGMQDHTAESIKSIEGVNTVWIEEAQTLSEKSLELLRPSIRTPGSEIWASWNPRNPSDPVDNFFRGSEGPPPDSLVMKVGWQDNPYWTPELEAERLHDYKTNPHRYAHIWEGEYEPMVVGAIWTRQTIHENRRETVPELARTLVAVDPAISSGTDANEHGIIVGGLGVDDGHGYIVDDLTTTGDPKKWGNRVVAAYDKWDADAVVIETNQGGEMCKAVIQSIRPNIRIIEVKATKGKHVRAEPISAQYSLGRVHHVGSFPELENQMCQMTAGGYEGDGSPDRCDAMVWLCTELFPAMNRVKRKSVSAPRPLSSGWMG